MLFCFVAFFFFFFSMGFTRPQLTSLTLPFPLFHSKHLFEPWTATTKKSPSKSTRSSPTSMKRQSAAKSCPEVCPYFIRCGFCCLSPSVGCMVFSCRLRRRRLTTLYLLFSTASSFRLSLLPRLHFSILINHLSTKPSSHYPPTLTSFQPIALSHGIF